MFWTRKISQDGGGRVKRSIILKTKKIIDIVSYALKMGVTYVFVVSGDRYTSQLTCTMCLPTHL